jgi:hypothetical protein
MQRRRDKLRAARLRPSQIWMPDTRAPSFAAECVRQARRVRDAETSESQADEAAWSDASDSTGWTA